MADPSQFLAELVLLDEEELENTAMQALRSLPSKKEMHRRKAALEKAQAAAKLSERAARREKRENEMEAAKKRKTIERKKENLMNPRVGGLTRNEYQKYQMEKGEKKREAVEEIKNGEAPGLEKDMADFNI